MLREIKSILLKTARVAIITTFVIGSTQTVFAATINDLDKSSAYARDSIALLAEKDIISGDNYGNFNPISNITRPEMAKFIVKSMGIDTTNLPDTPTFSDVPKEHWAYEYVEAAYRAGIIKGIPGGKFGVNDFCTREQMAGIFVRSLGISDEVINAVQGTKNLEQYKDNTSVASWAKGYVDFALSSGLMNGIGSGNFGPRLTAQREQVAVVTDRYLAENDKISGMAADINDLNKLYTAIKNSYPYKGEIEQKMIMNTTDKIANQNMIISSDIAGQVNGSDSSTAVKLSVSGTDFPEQSISYDSINVGGVNFIKEQGGVWEKLTEEDMENAGLMAFDSKESEQMYLNLLNEFGNLDIEKIGNVVIDGADTVKYSIKLTADNFNLIYPIDIIAGEDVDIKDYYNNGFELGIDIYLNQQGQVARETDSFSGGIKDETTDAVINISGESVYKNIGTVYEIKAPEITQ